MTGAPSVPAGLPPMCTAAVTRSITTTPVAISRLPSTAAWGLHRCFIPRSSVLRWLWQACWQRRSRGAVRLPWPLPSPGLPRLQGGSRLPRWYWRTVIRSWRGYWGMWGWGLGWRVWRLGFQVRSLAPGQVPKLFGKVVGVNVEERVQVSICTMGS
ncbi:hypothetical protein D3C85_1411930 [compost metagenome]